MSRDERNAAEDREITTQVEREPSVGTRAARREKPVLVTGGAGFVGCNVAHRLLSQGHRVVVLDNLSRAGVERNLAWLRDTHGSSLEVEVADIRDAAAVRQAVRRSRQVFHFAAQVAVTTSLDDPMQDFEVNARGTLNVLEAMRGMLEPPSLLFTSTNKVYGGLEDLRLELHGHRYQPIQADVRRRGVDESRPLDFHSPYGCSKGAADQYVIDYGRSFDLPTAVFRMSCIYGPRQFGTEDQGWVAHFLIRAMQGEEIVLYGDGRQVRDILFVDDLVDAMLLTQERMNEVRGQAFNVGGGVRNTTSLIELLSTISTLQASAPRVSMRDWRVGDQRYYVSNTSKLQDAIGWMPRVSVLEGLTRLHRWVRDSAIGAAAPEQRVRRMPRERHDEEMAMLIESASRPDSIAAGASAAESASGVA